LAGITRKVEYPGQFPCVERGDRCEPILRDHADRERCVETLVTVGAVADGELGQREHGAGSLAAWHAKVAVHKN
jgi:hypothetical protein